MADRLQYCCKVLEVMNKGRKVSNPYILNKNGFAYFQPGTKGNRGMCGIAIFPIIWDKFYV